MSILLPQLITADLYPNVYRVEENIFQPYSNINCNADFLSDDCTNSYNHQIPQLQEYRYVNDDGIDVVLRGKYDDVMSVVDVLNTYPPRKIIPGDDNKTIDFSDFSNNKPKNVPEVGMIVKGNHILVKMDKKVYSGSGVLIMIIQKKDNVLFDGNARFVLFRDVNTLQYNDLGGRIDKPISDLDKNILYINAKKEALEESMSLFKINNKSDLYVDIESSDTGSLYRVYLYALLVDDFTQFSTMYEYNKLQILKNYAANFNEAFRETDNLKIFDYISFINKLQYYGMGVTSSGIYQTIDGTNQKVSARTTKVISKFYTDGIFDNVFANKIFQNVSINKATGDNFMNTIVF